MRSTACSLLLLIAAILTVGCDSNPTTPGTSPASTDTESKANLIKGKRGMKFQEKPSPGKPAPKAQRDV